MKMFFPVALIMLISRMCLGDLDLSYQHITDDSIAGSSKKATSRPMSQVCLDIKSGDLDAQEVDLSHNHLTIDSMTQFLNFAHEEMTDLRKLDVSNNFLRHLPEDDMQDFEFALLKVLRNEKFELMDISSTPLARSQEWLQSFSKRYGEFTFKMKARA